MTERSRRAVATKGREDEMTERLGKYMQVEDQPPTRERRTRQWRITSRDGNTLGHVGWYAEWRQYVFAAAAVSVVFSHDCLRDITDFLNRKNAEQKAKRKEAAHGPV